MNILIIGGGNMGITYAQSFVKARLLHADQLTIMTRTPSKTKERIGDSSINITEHSAAAIQSADLIVIAVKPQDSAELFATVRSSCSIDQVYLSIMAGITIDKIKKQLGVSKIIRAMPNLPAQTGNGITVFTSSDEVTRIELIMVQNLLNTTGKAIYLEDESMIDAGTAVSGSGPAYVFYFMNALMEAAREMGFSDAEAELLVSQTFAGAVDLYQKSGDSCIEWIRKVASKGGTTEAALAVFDGNGLREKIKEGSFAACRRAAELGG